MHISQHILKFGCCSPIILCNIKSYDVSWDVFDALPKFSIPFQMQLSFGTNANFELRVDTWVVQILSIETAQASTSWCLIVMMTYCVCLYVGRGDRIHDFYLFYAKSDVKVCYDHVSLFH